MRLQHEKDLEKILLPLIVFQNNGYRTKKLTTIRFMFVFYYFDTLHLLTPWHMKKTCLILISGISVLFIKCHKPLNCGETRGLETSSLAISIFNTATNNYMYPREEFQSSFKKDSLQVFNEDGKKFNFVNFRLALDPRNNLNGYYGVNISPAFIIPDDNDAFTREKTRKIYLQYNYNTRDTLTLTFKVYKDKCDKGQYDYLKIYYRGELISSVNHTYYTSFTLNH